MAVIFRPTAGKGGKGNEGVDDAPGKGGQPRSVRGVEQIGPMGFAVAFLVPGTGTSVDQCDPLIPSFRGIGPETPISRMRMATDR